MTLTRYLRSVIKTARPGFCWQNEGRLGIDLQGRMEMSVDILWMCEVYTKKGDEKYLPVHKSIRINPFLYRIA